jgi:hypothetical protein
LVHKKEEEKEQKNMQIIDLKGNRIREKRKDGKDTDST